MTGLVFELAIMLVVILVAAELFTNALEHLGERLKISEGVTGSLLFLLALPILPEPSIMMTISGGLDARWPRP